jgi:hypothetical protein
MEKELSLSDPTLRGRLTELIRAMGFEVEKDEAASAISEDERRQILEDLASGKLKSEEAVKLLQGS